MLGEDTLFERQLKDFQEIENDLNKNVDEQEVKEQKEIPVGFDVHGNDITKGDEVSTSDANPIRGTVNAVWDDGSVDIEYTSGPGGPLADTFDIKGHGVQKLDVDADESKTNEQEVVDEDFEEFKGKGIELGDTVQIMDLEGNTTPVPKATVYAIDEALGDDGDMHFTIEVTGSDNEDEQEWYREDQYQIILLKKVGESETDEQEQDESKVNEATVDCPRCGGVLDVVEDDVRGEWERIDYYCPKCKRDFSRKIEFDQAGMTTSDEWDDEEGTPVDETKTNEEETEENKVDTVSNDPSFERAVEEFAQVEKDSNKNVEVEEEAGPRVRKEDVPDEVSVFVDKYEIARMYEMYETIHRGKLSIEQFAKLCVDNIVERYCSSEYIKEDDIEKFVDTPYVQEESKTNEQKEVKEQKLTTEEKLDVALELLSAAQEEEFEKTCKEMEGSSESKKENKEVKEEKVNEQD